MVEEKIYTLISRLAQRTAENKVDWKEAPTSKSYLASFKNYSILLTSKEADIYISILDQNGDIVERYSDVQLDREDRNTDSGWFPILNSLYEAARRNAKGVDQILDSLLEELDDDEIPF